MSVQSFSSPSLERAAGGENFDDSRSAQPFGVSTVLLLLLFCGLVLARVAAPLFNLLPSCLLKTALGLSCPTCGATRAGLALAQGEVIAAISYNPLFVFSVIALAGWAAIDLLERLGGIAAKFKSSNRDTLCFTKNFPQRRLLRWLMIAAIVLNWLYLILTAS